MFIVLFFCFCPLIIFLFSRWSKRSAGGYREVAVPTGVRLAGIAKRTKGWWVSRSEPRAGRYREANIIYLSSAVAIHLALRLPPRFLGSRPRYLVATPLYLVATHFVICAAEGVDTIEGRRRRVFVCRRVTSRATCGGFQFGWGFWNELGTNLERT